MLKEELDIVEAKRKIVIFIKREVTESRTDGVALGLSGGIDSSVTAYLSVEALGKAGNGSHNARPPCDAKAGPG